MLKFFKCDKCGWTTFCPSYKVRSDMTCGAVVQYLVADDPEVGENGPIKSLGMKPIGCGGKISEITQEEAMSYE